MINHRDIQEALAAAALGAEIVGNDVCFSKPIVAFRIPIESLGGIEALFIKNLAAFGLEIREIPNEPT